MRERKRRELGRSCRFLILQKGPEDGCKADGYCATQNGKPGNGSKAEPKRTREGHGSGRQVGDSDSKGGEPKVWRESDPLVILRERESR